MERKTALVCTALKSSVYSIVLQQGQVEGEGGFGDVSDVDCEVDDVLFGLAVAGALGPGDYW